MMVGPGTYVFLTQSRKVLRRNLAKRTSVKRRSIVTIPDVAYQRGGESTIDWVGT